MSRHLGYDATEHADPVAEFFAPEMASLPTHVVQALQHGPQAEPTLPSFEEVSALADPGYAQTENGYGARRDGGITVAVRTDMPGVTPQMWDWWFGWHGTDARYKLWHPRAHVSARWSDGGDDLRYVGRTSLVYEYLGTTFAHLAIRFVPPSTLGFDAAGPDGAVAICARTGSGGLPVDVGWLVHYVRPTPDGAEMRSRFWLGGRHVALRSGTSLADRVLRPVAARQLPHPRDLMVHCAQEMNHLAGFLPALHARFG